MKRPSLINNEIYHVYNRGVEKRKVFLDEQDYFRFIHDLFEFNDEAPALNIYYRLPHLQSYEVELRKIGSKEASPRKLQEEILAIWIKPNHNQL